ncbi:hypothetical protein HAX54_026122 [Datura stramonium]|uniref:Uncharacterized protein n=1 Tax=Datura stramonium TaxID=4076 RepID=A0ABS8V2R8_DATST|nr:hypothetical protein [Datura stramonium]
MRQLVTMFGDGPNRHGRGLRMFRVVNKENTVSRGDRDMEIVDVEVRAAPVENREVEAVKEKGKSTGKTLDIEVFRKGAREKDNSHVACGSGTLGFNLNGLATQA